MTTVEHVVSGAQDTLSATGTQASESRDPALMPLDSESSTRLAARLEAQGNATVTREWFARVAFGYLAFAFYRGKVGDVPASEARWTAHSPDALLPVLGLIRGAASHAMVGGDAFTRADALLRVKAEDGHELHWPVFGEIPRELWAGLTAWAEAAPGRRISFKVSDPFAPPLVLCVTCEGDAL